MAEDMVAADPPKTVISDIGESLAEAAYAWAQLTDALVRSRKLQQAVVHAHESSLAENQLSDISVIVSMDIDLSKLSKIRDLAQQFSLDVHDIWNQGSAASSNTS